MKNKYGRLRNFTEIVSHIVVIASFIGVIISVLLEFESAQLLASHLHQEGLLSKIFSSFSSHLTLLVFAGVSAIFFLPYIFGLMAAYLINDDSSYDNNEKTEAKLNNFIMRAIKLVFLIDFTHNESDHALFKLLKNNIFRILLAVIIAIVFFLLLKQIINCGVPEFFVSLIILFWALWIFDLVFVSVMTVKYAPQKTQSEEKNAIMALNNNISEKNTDDSTKEKNILIGPGIYLLMGQFSAIFASILFVDSDLIMLDKVDVGHYSPLRYIMIVSCIILWLGFFGEVIRKKHETVGGIIHLTSIVLFVLFLICDDIPQSVLLSRYDFIGELHNTTFHMNGPKGSSLNCDTNKPVYVWRNGHDIDYFSCTYKSKPTILYGKVIIKSYDDSTHLLSSDMPAVIKPTIRCSTVNQKTKLNNSRDLYCIKSWVSAH